MISAAFLFVGTLGVSDAETPSLTSKTQRAEVLFLAGAKQIGQGDYVAGRMYLDTLINTYPDSALTGQAKTLVFLSYAREGGPANARAEVILKQIDEFLRTRDAKPVVR